MLYLTMAGHFWGSSVTPLTIWSVASIGEENVESQILQIIRNQSQQSDGINIMISSLEGCSSCLFHKICRESFAYATQMQGTKFESNQSIDHG